MRGKKFQVSRTTTEKKKFWKQKKEFLEVEGKNCWKWKVPPEQRYKSN
jgi:hypothetical protein